MKAIILFMMISPILLAKTDSTQVDCSQDQWFGQDKVLHMTGSVGLVLGLNEIGGINTQSALIGTFTIGMLKEVYDKRYGSGCFSFKDIIANSIGIVIGFLFILNTG